MECDCQHYKLTWDGIQVFFVGACCGVWVGVWGIYYVVYVVMEKDAWWRPFGLQLCKKNIEVPDESLD